MVLGNSMQRQFDPTHEIRGGVNAAADALGPGALGPVRVLVTFPDGNAASAPAKEPLLQAVQQRMSQAPNVVTVQPAVFGNDYRSALVSAVLSVDPEDMAARESVDWMRAELPPVVGDNAKIDVGGPTALIKDFDDRVSKTQPAVFGFVALIAFVMLLVSIRSVFLAFKGVLMTVLSVAAAYGSLVVVFQWGWLEELGFRPISSLDSTIPPLVLAMTFGLSMDYEIFLLTRIRERFLQTNNTRDAVAYGVSTSARTITSAALIMIAVFIGFAFAGMPLVAQLGVACAVAIAVDATVVRLILVPALMAMFDEWNWWLPRLAGPHPAVGGLREAAAEGRHRRSGHHPRRHLDAGGVGNRHPHGGQVGGQAQEPWRRTRSPSPIRSRSAAACRPTARNASTRSTAHTNGHPHTNGAANGKTVKLKRGPRPMHPVTMWRGRLSVALDALETEAETERPPVERNSPMETTNVQLPTGDRLSDTDRGGDVAAEELPDHVPEQHQRLRRVCRFGRLDGDSNRRCGTGRNGSVLLW